MGWNLGIKGKSIHLIEPFTSVPINGTRAKNIKKIKNKAVYYVNSEEDLVIALNTIKESENINFEQYLYNGTYTKNIEKLLSSIL